MKIFKTTKVGEILIKLKELKQMKNMSQLSRITECTYSHCKKILDNLEADGLVRHIRKKREIIIKITDKGESVVNHLIKIKKLINN